MMRQLGYFLGGFYIGTFAFVAFSTIGKTYGGTPWVMDIQSALFITSIFVLPFFLGMMAGKDK